jgi:hypothetical protein
MMLLQPKIMCIAGLYTDELGWIHNIVVLAKVLRYKLRFQIKGKGYAQGWRD